jgi:hypothetical protein
MAKLIELYAGFAGLSCYVLGARPPVSRIGSKFGYAEAILDESGFSKSDFESILIVDSDERVTNLWSCLMIQGAIGLRAELLMERGKEGWEYARTESPCSAADHEAAAAFVVSVAGSRGGVGGWRGTHKHRPSVNGFSPSPETIKKRLDRLSDLLGRMPRCSWTINRKAEEIPPTAFGTGNLVYIDPPYYGRTGYGKQERSDFVSVAESWRVAGNKVIVSYDSPVEIGQSWRHVDITSKRKGQKRVSLSKNNREWLTISS